MNAVVMTQILFIHEIVWKSVELLKECKYNYVLNDPGDTRKVLGSSLKCNTLQYTI